MVLGARRAASRTGYAWRRHRQPDVSCSVDLSCAAGRFLQVEVVWSASDLLTRLAGISVPGISEQGLALQVQDHEVAIVEREREVQELKLFCLDEGQKRNTVNRCETGEPCL